ncbi:MAG: aminopeptidase, partial [Clostridia bacterium]|nr:aminopeptidase [Clostridia bacterium]
MLAECALVPYFSPINNSVILFYNTLFDENASCHLALGRGFSNCIKDFDKYTQEDFDNMGVNTSMIHVDFMIGDSTLDIVGETKDGKKIQIFKNGNWAF